MTSEQKRAPVKPNPSRNGHGPQPPPIPKIPEAVDAEQAVLGSILLEPERLDEINLKPSAFYLEKHQWIYQALLDLRDANTSIDNVSVRTRLELAGRLESVGGSAYITLLLNAVPTAAHAKTYAELVRNAYFARQTIAISKRLAGYGYDGNGKSASDFLAELEKSINELRQEDSSSQDFDLSTWANMAELIGPVVWDWKPWLPKGMLVILASMSGEGKSYCLIRIAASYLSCHPWPDSRPFESEPGLVLWCEAEAGQGIHLERAQQMNLPLERFISPLGDPLLDVSLDSKEHRARIAHFAHIDDIKLVVVDSLSGSQRGDEKANTYADAAKWLGQLARDTRKPILLAHHLRKKGLLDGDEITLDRLRGTGAIAQYARVIWAIDAPNPLTPEKKRLKVIKSNLAKFPNALGFEIGNQGITFSQAPEAPHKETIIDRAADLLVALLQHGPKASDEIQRQIEAAGFSWASARRAKDRIGIVAVKRGNNWMWSLPAQKDI